MCSPDSCLPFSTPWPLWVAPRMSQTVVFGHVVKVDYGTIGNCFESVRKTDKKAVTHESRVHEIVAPLTVGFGSKEDRRFAREPIAQRRMAQNRLIVSDHQAGIRFGSAEVEIHSHPRS